MTLLGAELRILEANWRQASGHAEDARRARDEAIRRALAEGMTQRHVAEVTGLSPGRIGQIATRKDER